MKNLPILLFLSIFTLSAQSQTYQGKIANGSTVSISLTRNGNEVTVSRQVTGSGSGTILVNEAGLNVIDGKFTISSGNIWIIPFDPGEAPVQARLNACYEYRCDCAPACSPPANKGGCVSSTFNGTTSCGGDGSGGCNCCSGFMVRVDCNGRSILEDFGSSSFMIVNASAIH